MSKQVYKCEIHGEFEVTIPFGKGVPKEASCPEVVGRLGKAQFCDVASSWVPSVPNFIGGPTTGAGNK